MQRHGGGDTWPEVPERENLCKVSILFLNLESVLYLNPDPTIGAQLGGVGRQHLGKSKTTRGRTKALLPHGVGWKAISPGGSEGHKKAHKRKRINRRTSGTKKTHDKWSRAEES